MARLHKARGLLRDYNETRSTETERRADLLQDLLGGVADGVWVEPPFFCDYGDNIRLGKGVFINLNCVFLDGDQINVGEGTLFGPAVQVYATSHPLRAEERMFERGGLPAYRTTAAPVDIGRNVWIGGGAIILPGVTIGDGTTIGAGAVVTASVPSGVFAAGNPCQVLRTL